jgi:hypothetical protein
MIARHLLLTALPWVLVSHVATMQCTPGGCVPSPDIPLASRQVLSTFATKERCEQEAAAPRRRWDDLERHVAADRPPPQAAELRMAAAFHCEPAPEAPEAR